MLNYVSLATKLVFASNDRRKEIARENDISLYRLMAAASYLMRWVPLPLKTVFYLNGTDKHTERGHKYGPHYDLFLRSFKWRRVKLLEIGIGGYEKSVGGRSINAWRWYFPFGRVVACDIEERSMLENRGVKLYQIDQSNRGDLSQLMAKEGYFDIIIDDGSHLNSHQIFTFTVLFQCLSNGGFYVIEDTQTSFWPHMGGHHLADPGQSCMDYFLELAKYLNACEFLSESGVRQELKRIADNISMISIHHNLIFIRKDTGKKTSNAVFSDASAAVRTFKANCSNV